VLYCDFDSNSDWVIGRPFSHSFPCTKNLRFTFRKCNS